MWIIVQVVSSRSLYNRFHWTSTRINPPPNPKIWSLGICSEKLDAVKGGYSV